jgi:hypothetical protein
MTDLLDVTTGIAPGAYPVPAGRGRWRLTLHSRVYDGVTTWQNSIIAELPTAATRKLVQTWGAPAVLTFSLNGWSPAAGAVTELQQDVIAWRWDDTRGVDEAIFRGVVTDSQDDLDEQDHTVTFTAHDYLAVLNRRILTANLATNADQDDIVNALLLLATNNCTTTSGTPLTPGSMLPVVLDPVNPDGTNRGKSGFLRTRSYLPQQNIGVALNDLSLVQGVAVPGTGSFYNAYDYDLTPGWRYGTDQSNDMLRLFYPQQGVANTVCVLVYPGTLAKVRRQVASTDYSNYVRVLGNNQSASAATAQLYAEAVNLGDAAGTTVGLWMDAQNAADVIDQPTLNQKAAGYLDTEGVLQPVYTLTLTPGVYYSGWFNMGDTVPLVVESGRLNVNTQVRILGIEYDIGDDGQEDLILTVGRPDTTLFKVLSKQRRDVEALARR